MIRNVLDGSCMTRRQEVVGPPRDQRGGQERRGASAAYQFYDGEELKALGSQHESAIEVLLIGGHRLAILPSRDGSIPYFCLAPGP